MRKKLLSAIVMIMMIITALPANVIANENPIKVFLDGNQMSFSSNPVLVNGRTMVPMRSIFEALNWEVSWEEPDKIYAHVTGEEIDGFMMRIGNTKVYDTFPEDVTADNPVYKVTSTFSTLDAAPVVSDGTTMVPLRFVAERADTLVEWNASTSTANIYTYGYLEDNNKTDLLSKLQSQMNGKYDANLGETVADHTAQDTANQTYPADDSAIGTMKTDKDSIVKMFTNYYSYYDGRDDRGIQIDQDSFYTKNVTNIANGMKSQSYTINSYGVESPTFLSGYQALYLDITTGNNNRIYMQLGLPDMTTLYVHYGESIDKNAMPDSEDIYKTDQVKKPITDAIDTPAGPIDQNVVDMFTTYWRDKKYGDCFYLDGTAKYEIKDMTTKLYSDKDDHTVYTASHNDPRLIGIFGNGYYMLVHSTEDKTRYTLYYIADFDKDTMYGDNEYFIDQPFTYAELSKLKGREYEEIYTKYVEPIKVAKPIINIGDRVFTAGYFDRYVGTVQQLQGDKALVYWDDVTDMAGFARLLTLTYDTRMDYTVNPYINLFQSTWIPMDLITK